MNQHAMRVSVQGVQPHAHRTMASMVLVLALVAFSIAPASAAAPKTYGSPEDAASALDAAWRSGSTSALIEIFGSAGDSLVRSGDRVAEQMARERLAAVYEEAHHIDVESSGFAFLVLGKDDWPYPIPMVHDGTRWHFDAKAGEQQIINRRIGRNELGVLAFCQAFVEAQHDYAAAVPGSGGEYALRLTSSPGKRDGLYWQPGTGEADSPLGPLIASADAEGYGWGREHAHEPYHGYFYKVLKEQGQAAPGGARRYIVDGKMTGGFALLAFPARYGSSGVMTFMVNQEGIVFEKNLGPQTSAIARRMTEFNPDKSWTVAKP